MGRLIGHGRGRGKGEVCGGRYGGDGWCVGGFSYRRCGVGCGG